MCVHYESPTLSCGHVEPPATHPTADMDPRCDGSRRPTCPAYIIRPMVVPWTAKCKRCYQVEFFIMQVKRWPR
jgi:hypothetical protein